jgi:SAM-dependent methyltransferase
MPGAVADLQPSSARRYLKWIPLATRAVRYLRRHRQEWEFARRFTEFRTKAEASVPRFQIAWEDRYPILGENTATTGFDRHYIYHTAWAARLLAESRPAVHVDISSDLYFSTLVSAFVPVQFYDYRPAELRLDGLITGAADLTALPFADDSIRSLSCMHVVEHVGLGRYGDPLDPDGDLKAIGELTRVLAPGGQLFFVVPVGNPRVMFNAHRIYAYHQIVQYFAGLHLTEFALIPDAPEEGGLIRHATSEMADRQSYGCGCFRFVKAGTG